MRIPTLTTAALTALALTAPAWARPPTTTISPGYDRRLQESRQAPAQGTTTQPYLQPLSPIPGHRRHPYRRKPRH